MSHFCVAVATKTKDISEIEKLLEPYWEEKEVEPYIRRTKADIIEDARKWKADFEAELKENPEKEMFEWQQKYLILKATVNDKIGIHKCKASSTKHCTPTCINTSYMFK